MKVEMGVGGVKTHSKGLVKNSYIIEEMKCLIWPSEMHASHVIIPSRMLLLARPPPLLILVDEDVIIRRAVALSMSSFNAINSDFLLVSYWLRCRLIRLEFIIASTSLDSFRETSFSGFIRLPKPVLRAV